jgi:hypothetical protein
LNAVEVGLYAKLAADSAIVAKLGSAKIYNLVIPQGISLPAIRCFYSGGGEENLTPTRSFSTVYGVIGVSETSMKHVGEIADLIDACLHGGTLTVSGWTNQFWTAREGLIRFHELDEAGKDYWHAGAYYRIRASAS